MSLHEQLLAIGSEVMRAIVWQEKDKDKFHSALERALALVDLCLDEQKWRRYRYALLFLREELSKWYIGLQGDSLTRLLSGF